MRPVVAVLALVLAGCGGDRSAALPTGTAVDGLPLSADGLALDGSTIVPPAEVPSGPGDVRRALANPAIGWTGEEIPWGEQRAAGATLTPPPGMDHLGAWIAGDDRRRTLGVGAQTFRVVSVFGSYATPQPGAGSGPVWAVHPVGIVRGEGTAHALVAWDGTRHVIAGRMRGRREDILATMPVLMPWRAYATRLRRAVDKGADLRQMADDLRIAAHLPADCRGEVDALLAARTAALAREFAALGPVGGDPVAAGARLPAVLRLHSDARILAAAGVVERATAWRRELARTAQVAAATDGLARCGLQVLAWKALAGAPALDALAGLVPEPRILADLPLAQALGIAALPRIDRPWTVETAPTAFPDLVRSERRDTLQQSYTVANPDHPRWAQALAAATAEADRIRAALRSARATMASNEAYTTARKVTVIEPNGTKVMERTEYDTNFGMKAAYEAAARDAAGHELALGQAESVVAGLQAAEPPRRLPRIGTYAVEWQDWRGTAITPAVLRGADGTVVDVTVRTPIREGDQRSDGFSAPGMLPEEGLPRRDDWRTRAQVEAALAPAQAALAATAVRTALLAETHRRAGGGPWAVWLLAAPGAAALSADLLRPGSP
ncbi:MAG: hypothetical protein RLZZ127_466 [Planctomycetota bacterium]|jgi:hypothetical protein